MADDEQFSLCWNNFNTNLSAGFHESLCRGDLVDVTLAAEGQLVKAHRLVLSVCSPYFRNMFTQMPANQHAFVFLKDVSHTALKDLIQFMYCGEVNVKQEALPAFISTAEALQIKGLTDSDPPASQSPTRPSTPALQSSPIQQTTSPPRARHRASTSRSYNVDSIDGSVEDCKQGGTQIVIQTTVAPKAQTIVQQPQHHIQPQQQSYQQQQATNTVSTVTHKRPAQRNSSGTSSVKRTKTIIDPLDPIESAPSTQQQITVQTVAAEKPASQQSKEFIDLPIELPTKSEPDYTEEAGEAESAEQEATYVEDDSYGDMRYDESYFTENEDAAANTTVGAVGSHGAAVGASTSKAVVKQSFSDSSYAETSDQTHEAQEVLNALTATSTRRRGRPKLRQGDSTTQEKLIDKITAAVSNGLGEPVVYASTTKGSIKLLYNGHYFAYLFRKGQYSVFQCCYKENKEQCKVRVVSDQKRVFHLDGEHVHFIQATDKSVTSLIFETGCTNDDSLKQNNINNPGEVTETSVPLGSEEIEHEKSVTQASDTQMDLKAGDKENPDNFPAQPELDANYFREKIKKRLQKALLGKKK